MLNGERCCEAQNFTDRTLTKTISKPKQLVIKVDKATCTYNDYIEGLAEMMENSKRRDKKIDELLENTLENLKVFEETLANR
jgi:hypothetical protein